MASCKGYLDIVLLLVQRGADTRGAGRDGHTPIFFAVDQKHMPVVQALLPHAEPSRLNFDGHSLLHHAALFGGPAMVEAVLPLYVEIGAVDIPAGLNKGNPLKPETGRTPLMVACSAAKYAEAKLLLKAGASRQAKDAEGVGVLHCCGFGMSLACLQLLLGEAPNWHFTPQQVNEADKVGFTALSALGLNGNVDMRKLLMAAGAVARSRPEASDQAAASDPSVGAQEPLAPPCCVA
jgi:ankyrin repeat protein